MSPLRTAAAALAFTLALPALATAQDTLPPGTMVAEAIAADLPEEGVNFSASNFLGLIPPDLVIGSIPSQEIFEIPWVCTQDVWLENLVLHTTVNAITADGVPPGGNYPDGALVVNVNVTISVNDPNDTASVFFDGCLDYVCNLHTVPATVNLDLPVTLRTAVNQETGEDFIDIEFGALQHNIEAALGGTIYMTGCAIGDIDAWLNDNLSISAFDLVIGQLVGEVETQVADALVDAEVAGEEALLALWLEDSTDILDTELNYELQPNFIDHNDAGVRILMSGRTWADPHPCVADAGLDGSAWTDSTIPPMTESVPSNNAVYHLGAMLADDFANQALFSLWNGGVLCYIVNDEDVSGFAIDTTLFGLLGGQAAPDLFGRFFPDGAAPMVIRTKPEAPPAIRFDGPNDINIAIEGLNVQFAPLILDRFTNLVTVAIDLDVGLDVSVAPDGALAIDIFLDTDDLNPRVTYNELSPEDNAIVEANFGQLVGSVVNLVAGDLLEGMKIALPVLGGATGDDDDSAVGDDDDSAAAYGLGAVALDLEAVGLSSSLLDFVGAYILLGDSTGGESSGGCGDCGDTSGCGSCAGEGGGCGDCGDLAGCDIQQELEDSGCSGETSGQPDDLGCQGCRLGSGVHRVSKNHWRVSVDAGGATVVPHPHRHQRRGPHPAALLFALIPAVWLRRRRTASERG